MKQLLLTVLLIGPLSGCADETQSPSALDASLQIIVRAFDARPLPTKPFEQDAKYILGQALFFDAILSGNRDISCAACHLMARGASDGLPRSLGTGASGLAENRELPADRPIQPRNALDLWNRDNNRVKSMFWDGRVEGIDPELRSFRSPLGDLLPQGLENTMAVQALFPLAQADEMLGLPGDISPSGLPQPHSGKRNEFVTTAPELPEPLRITEVLERVMRRLVGTGQNSTEPWQERYRDLFASAYPGREDGDYSIVDAANALAHFEEIAFATRSSAWDEYLSGDLTALDHKAKRGAILFFGRARCVVCHEGPLFSDFTFHAVGVPANSNNNIPEDLGRFQVTGIPEDKYKFRTPPLRNVTLTAPYFHDGSVPTLQAVIAQHLDPYSYADHYADDGSFLMKRPEIDAISPLLVPRPNLNGRDIDDLIAFLAALEDTAPLPVSDIVPVSVPSGLPVARIDQ